MYSYRIKGVVSVVAGVQSVGLAAGVLLLDRTGLVFLPGTGAFSALLVQSVLPWVLGIAAESLWYVLRAVPQKASLKNSLARSGMAAIPAGCFWWGATTVQHPAWAAVWLAFFAILTGLHGLLPSVIRRAFFSGSHAQRAVLVGASSQAARLRSVLGAREDMGIVPAGWLASDVAEEDADGIPKWGHANDLEEVIRREGVQQVILAGGPMEGICPRLLASTCERLGVRLTLAQPLGLGLDRNLHWETEGDWCVGAFYKEPLQSPWNRTLKRLLDLVVSSLALVLVFLPISIATLIAQRLQSPGPLFCRQWRHGLGNQPFRIWKFRTMHPNSGAISKQAALGDSRVFPFARWLRRHSLDEIPQFLNVLRGEMSVVGPRPHLLEHTIEFSNQHRYHIRSFVKPGITGLAQVNGCRGELTQPEDLRRRVDWDIWYLENWTLALDLEIMAKTFREMFFPSRSAY
ncbi:MAG: hypothetical protein RLZZ399_566 [Verrucomicrobiota bacterium]|jgi:exopolysaccharide biosynthesis polyprenyl glycosylphosphotransferase